MSPTPNLPLPGHNPPAPRFATYHAAFQAGAALLPSGPSARAALRVVQLRFFEALCAEPDAPADLLHALSRDLNDATSPAFGLRALALMAGRESNNANAIKLLTRAHSSSHKCFIHITRKQLQAGAHEAHKALVLSAIHRVALRLEPQRLAPQAWSELLTLLPRVTDGEAWACLLRDAEARGATAQLITAAPALLDHVSNDHIHATLLPAVLAEPDNEQALISLRKHLRTSASHLGQTAALALAGRGDPAWLTTLKPLPEDAADARAWGRIALIAFDAHAAADHAGARALLPKLLDAAACSFTETFGAQALLLANLAARDDAAARAAQLARAVALLRKMPRKTEGFPDDALALLDALCALDAWPLAHDTLGLLKTTVYERGLALMAARYAALGDHHGAAALLAPITRGPIATQAALDCLLASAPR
jgi:hypothetical protein